MDEMTASAVHEGVIWIEVLSRQHDVVARHRLSALPITIGRAYDNDVVVDDPHVAAHHLRIVRDENGELEAEDLGSRNGLYFDHERTRRERIVLDGERALRIGHTLVRVRAATHAVPEELPVVRGLPFWPAAILCVAGVFAVTLLDVWLRETGESKAIRYFTPIVILAAAICIWVAAWSVLTRVFTGRARFGLHFLIISAGVLAFSLYDQLAELGAFALSWTALATTTYIVAWLMLGAVCVAHLLAMNRARPTPKIAVIAVLIAAGIAMQTLRQSEWRSTYGAPVTLQRLEPPALRLVSPQREAAFFTDATALRAKLDKARSEEPSDSESWNDSDD